MERCETPVETRAARLKLPIKGTLLINPSSGARLAPAEMTAIEEASRAAGLEVLQFTPSLDVAQAIRQRTSEGVRLFVAAGGDGTVHSAVQSLINTESILGVLPIGTYNHFARDLGIPLAWRDALEVAVSGATSQIDCGRANERFFVNNVSMGLYPELVARRESRGRGYPRWKARIWAAYGTLRSYPHVTVTLETEHHHEMIRTHVLMVSNNSYDLSRIGVEAPRATLKEGRLSVYWLPHLPRLSLMKFVAHYLAGRVHEAPGFRSFRTQRMRVESSRRSLHLGIDGEVFSVAMPLVITIVPKSLLVKVPR